MKRSYYVAYGSNLNIRQMRLRCKGATPVGVGYLKDWELFYAGSFSGNYATIRQKKGGIVPVAVWLISKENEFALDRYEGWPRFYTKRDIEVHMVTGQIGKKITGMVYIMNTKAKEGKPSPSYVATCRYGYRDFGIAERYLDESLIRAGIEDPDSEIWNQW